MGVSGSGVYIEVYTYHCITGEVFVCNTPLTRLRKHVCRMLVLQKKTFCVPNSLCLCYKNQ